jgi:hypothetical protein
MYKTIILPILYRYETWSLTVREKYRMTAFDNKVLNRIFRPKVAEVTEGQRKVHNEELHNVYSSLHILRVIKSRKTGWERHVGRG